MLADLTQCYRYQGQVNHFAKFAKEKIPCASLPYSTFSIPTPPPPSSSNNQA